MSAGFYTPEKDQLEYRTRTVLWNGLVYWMRSAISGKVFKNGPSKICGRRPLKNFTWPFLEYFVLNSPSPNNQQTSLLFQDFLSENITSFQTTSTPSSVSIARYELSIPGAFRWLNCGEKLQRNIQFLLQRPELRAGACIPFHRKSVYIFLNLQNRLKFF